jgi:hypothetical protein
MRIASVLSALGLLVACSDGAVISDNARPTATIELPEAGATAFVGDPVVFQGLAVDVGTASDLLEVTWSSSRQGSLATGTADADGRHTFEVSDLIPGLHIVTMEVRDPQGATGEDTVTIDLRDPEIRVNTPPTAPTVAISPLEPVPSDALVCSISVPSVDVDEDSISYDFAWTRSDEVLFELDGADASGELVAESTETLNGDQWTCTVTPNDGTEAGRAGDATVIVGCPAGSGVHEDCPGTSCLTILQAGHSRGDGTYWIDAATLLVFEVQCDMTTDAGGWTGITFPIAAQLLGGGLSALDSAGIEGIDPVHGPFTQDGAGAHAYRYDFDFSPGYDAYYLGGDYLIASNACETGCDCGGAPCDSDVSSDCWTQSTWAQGYANTGCGSFGEVSHGSPSDGGPSSTLSSHFGPHEAWAFGESFAWPGGTTAYSVGAAATEFRLAWGETGYQAEGWYPWFEGTIFLR